MRVTTQINILLREAGGLKNSTYEELLKRIRKQVFMQLKGLGSVDD